MVQNNFGGKKKQPGPDSNLSILQRLGIDEGVDYNKPLDPNAFGSMFRPPNSLAGLAGFLPPQSHSTSTRSNSSECSSPDRFKNERPASTKSDISVKSQPLDDAASSTQLQATPLASTLKGVKSPGKKEPDDIKNDDAEEEEEEGNKGDEKENGDEAGSLRRIRTRRAAKIEEQKQRKDEDDSPRSRSASPPASDHPVAPILGDFISKKLRKSPSPIAPLDGGTDIDDEKPESKKNGDHRSGDGSRHSNSPGDEDMNHGDMSDHDDGKGDEKSGKKSSSHPLAALQMLCDKTEKTNPKGNSGSNSTQYSSTGTDPGAILAFSWACNQAVVNDSLLKCPFCDTPFISKGAYRHHLSKMHFVKDGSTPDPKMFMKAAVAAAANKDNPTDKNIPTTAAAAIAAIAAAASSAGTAAPNAGASQDSKEENTQSKFQKYSQLAKQLSCSSQP